MDFKTEAINAHVDKLRQHFYYQQNRLDLIVNRLGIGLVYSKVNIVQSEFVKPGTYLHTTAVSGKRPIALSRLTLGDCPQHPLDDRAFVWGLVLELMRIKDDSYNGRFDGNTAVEEMVEFLLAETEGMA